MKELFSNILEITIVTSIIIALVGILYTFLSKRYDAKWRCIVWVVLAIRLIIPFNMSLDVPTFVIPEPQRAEIVVPKTSVVEKQNQQTPTVKADEKNKAQTSSELAPIMQEKIIPPTVNEQSQNVSMWVDKVVIASYIWLVGMVIALLIKLIQVHRFHRYVKRWGKSVEDKRIQNILHSICFQMGMTKKITPLYCQGISSPMVVGLIKSRLLLPNSNYSDKELYAVLRHELVHIKQHHLWMKVLAMVCEIVYWFNPFVYLMSYLMNKDIEYACDSKVLKLTSQDYKEDYSKAILSVVSRSVGGMRPVLVAGFGNGKKTLMSRFSNIFDGDKKKKGTIALIIVVIAVVVIGSFFVFGEKEVEQVNDSLTIYKMEPIIGADGYIDSVDPYIVEDAVRRYKDKYPNVKVNVVDFTGSSLDEFYDKLTIELLAGKGPDFIIGGPNFSKRKDINKLISSGVFAEMDEFLKDDKSFDINNYYEPIMNQGLHKGRRYIMPLRFNFPFMIGAESKLKEAGIDVENCQKDYLGFLKEVNQYITNNKGDAEILGHQSAMYNMLDYIGAYATEDMPDFSTKDFKTAIELYKPWYPFDKEENIRDKAGASETIKDSKLLFSYRPEIVINTLTYNGVCRIHNFDKPVLFSLRKPGGGIEAKINVFAGINNSSENKLNAYNFIKMMMSPDGEFFHYDIHGLSVNKKITQSIIQLSLDVEDHLDGDEYEYKYDGLRLKDVPKEYADQLFNIINEIDSAHFKTPVTTEILTQLDPFFKGEKTYDECIKKAEEKVKIYLAE